MAGNDLVSDILDWLTEHNLLAACGIVYCLTRKDAETLAEQLRTAGLSAAHYHADMEAASRQAVHLQWCRGYLCPLLLT